MSEDFNRLESVCFLKNSAKYTCKGDEKNECIRLCQGVF